MNEAPNKVAKILAVMLNRQVQPNESLALGSPPEWDSLIHIEIMLLLEEEFSRQITSEQIAELTTQRKIVDFFS